MKQRQHKIADLLSHAVQGAEARHQLLFLLSLLAGLLSSIVFAPSYDVFQDFSEVLSAGAEDASTTEAMALLSDSWLVVVIGQLLATFISGMLLVPWARAMLGGNVMP